jgi:hypothetical protein
MKVSSPPSHFMYLVVSEVTDYVLLQSGVAMLPGFDPATLFDQVARLLGRLQPRLEVARDAYSEHWE